MRTIKVSGLLIGDLNLVGKLYDQHFPKPSDVKFWEMHGGMLAWSIHDSSKKWHAH
jgi:hypothetical protein